MQASTHGSGGREIGRQLQIVVWRDRWTTGARQRANVKMSPRQGNRLEEWAANRVPSPD